MTKIDISVDGNRCRVEFEEYGHLTTTDIMEVTNHIVNSLKNNSNEDYKTIFDDCTKNTDDNDSSKIVLVKYFNDVYGDSPNKPIGYVGGRSKSNWIDLYANGHYDLTAGEYFNIPLGVAIKLPAGYEAIIAPRSSTFKTYGLLQADSIGIIDESYCGPNDQWYFPAYATRDTHICNGDRICQFRIIKHQPDVNLIVTEELDGENRGGFGTSGKQ